MQKGLPQKDWSDRRTPWPNSGKDSSSRLGRGSLLDRKNSNRGCGHFCFMMSIDGCFCPFRSFDQKVRVKPCSH